MEPDASPRGIAHSLELNGGRIRAVADQTDARLWFAGVGHDSNHRVDWQR